MKKVILVAFLVAMMISSSYQTSSLNPSVIQCLLAVSGKLGNLSTDPISVLTAFTTCTGSQTWNYLAPFLGGYIRPLCAYILAQPSPPAISKLALYNMVMSMAKEAFGEF